jgi:threonine/homoserine/homoserine lactone efflux protein
MWDAVITGLIFGLALVFSVGPVIFTLLKLRINYGLSSAFHFIAGVWLSDILWMMFKRYYTKEEMDAGVVSIGKSTNIRLFLTGFFINTLNPGVVALWFAAATQTITNTNEEKGIIFGVCIAITIFADILKIKLAGKLRQKLTNKNIQLINRIAGFMFIIFAAILMAGVFLNKV